MGRSVIVCILNHRYSNTDSVRLSEYNPYSMITINPYETKKVQFQLTPNLEYPTRTEGIIRFFYTFNFEIHFRGCNLIMIFEYKMNVGNTLEIPIIQRITPSAPPMESSNGIQIFVEPCKIGEFSESPPPYVEIEEKNE